MLNLFRQRPSNQSVPPPQQPIQNSELPDKHYLWGEWLKGEERRRKWQDELHRRGTMKALDMAADEMGDVTTTVNKGMGVRELGMIGAIILGALAFMNSDKLLPNNNGNSNNSQQAAGPADTEYDVRFYNKDGELIDVPQRRE